MPSSGSKKIPALISKKCGNLNISFVSYFKEKYSQSSEKSNCYLDLLGGIHQMIGKDLWIHMNTKR